mgnify:FL=1
MNRILGLLMSGMNAYMDFGVGVAIAQTLSVLAAHPLPWWFLPLGGMLALLPDFDILVPLIWRGAFNYNHHKTLLHRPLFMLPLVACFGWLWGGPFWAGAAFICVFWHYLHDTWPLGVGGVAWVWPISDQYLTWRGFKEPVDMSHTEWLKRYWLKPTLFSCWEIAVGTAALAWAAFLLEVPAFDIVMLAALAWLGAALVWFAYSLPTYQKTP